MSSTFEEKCITCPLITKKSHHDLLQFHCLITTNHHIMILTRSSSINHFPLSLTINHHHIMFHMPNNGELKPPPVESYQITMFDHVCWSNTTKSLFSLVKKISHLSNPWGWFLVLMLVSLSLHIPITSPFLSLKYLICHESHSQTPIVNAYILLNPHTIAINSSQIPDIMFNLW